MRRPCWRASRSPGNWAMIRSRSMSCPRRTACRSDRRIVRMKLFDKLLGRKPEPPSVPASFNRGAIGHDLPLGLRIGGRITFDRTMYRVAPGAMTAELPDGFQGIPCYGHIDLGDGYALHRFY